jgi:hypothetical protein
LTRTFHCIVKRGRAKCTYVLYTYDVQIHMYLYMYISLNTTSYTFQVDLNRIERCVYSVKTIAFFFCNVQVSVLPMLYILLFSVAVAVESTCLACYRILIAFLNDIQQNVKEYNNATTFETLV